MTITSLVHGQAPASLIESVDARTKLAGSNRMEIENNRFSENGWAIQIQRSSSDNTYRRNNFTGNSFDIAADGELDNNRFSNNHWDKYEGYDLKRDGIGDVPFRPVSLYAVVVGRIPSSVLLLRSPVVHLLDLLGIDREYPAVYEVLERRAARIAEQTRLDRLQRLADKAKARYG
jgi:parallel beta-helix repeat protein